MNIWDVVNSINHNKSLEYDEEVEYVYSAWTINRQLSYFPDTLLYAQEMNILNQLDKKLQYDYLFNGIRSKKRYAKWAKKVEDKDVEIVKQYYKCNDTRAEEYLKILTAEQIKELARRMEKGGRKK
jgi:hypothetical protein